VVNEKIMSVYAEIFWEHLQVVGYLLASTERVLETFGENPKSYWRPCGKCSKTSGDILGYAQIKIETCWSSFLPLFSDDFIG
jgi:hypothetical protein